MFVHRKLVSNVQKCTIPIESFQQKCFRSSLVDHLVKPITVNTGKSLYPKLRLQNPKLYKHYRSGGLDLTVDYLDTKKDGKQYNKVIVAIHGCPDTYRTFTKLALHYLDSDVRVIAPNLPDFTHTRRSKIFWHTSEEKSRFVRDFLYQINVDTVDCLISHSFGIQAISHLWLKSFDLNIKSVAIIAPETLIDTDKYKNPLIIRALFLFRSEWWFKFISMLKFYKINYFPLNLKNINESLSLYAPIYFDVEGVKGISDRIALLKELDIPTVVTFGTAEPIMTRDSSDQLRDILSIPPNQVVNIDQSNYKLEDLTLKQRQSFFWIKDARHFVHSTHSQIMNQIVDNLLKC